MVKMENISDMKWMFWMLHSIEVWRGTIFERLYVVLMFASYWQVKEKDTVWFVKFCVPWCKHW